jgi:hypothetical protein
MQVDSAATCNTLPTNLYGKLGCQEPLKPSRARIHPYSGGAIRPVGKQSLVCEGTNNFQILDFEVIASTDIPDKPALLSGKDSERLGLITFDKNRILASSTSPVTPPRDSGLPAIHTITDTQTNTSRKLIPGTITKNDLTSTYKDNFEGLGDIGKPVHLTLNPDVTPRHASVHRVPVSKMDTVKVKLQEMVKEGKLAKVETPTDWCSNMLVKEKTRPDGSTKVRICLDPSQTINKAINIPHYQIPTTQEYQPKLSGKKYKTFSIFDALDGFTQVRLDDASSFYTTMHTPGADIAGSDSPMASAMPQRTSN